MSTTARVEKEWDDVVEVTCRIVLKDLEVRVIGVHFNEDTNTWSETDLTDFIPLDEAIRIQGLADEMRAKALSRIKRKATK